MPAPPYYLLTSFFTVLLLHAADGVAILSATLGNVFSTVSTNFGFLCPSGSFIQRFRGTGEEIVNSIGLICSDGTVSDTYGYGNYGTPVNIPGCASGFSSVDLKYGQWIGQIVPYCEGSAAGILGTGVGDGGGSSASTSCPDNTVLVGLQGTYAVHGLTRLLFVCQQPTGT